MIGAIVGDITGRNFECSVWRGSTFADARCVGYDREIWWSDRTGVKATEIDLLDADTGPTDDSILTIVVAQWFLDGGNLRERIRQTVRTTPYAGWGGRLQKWALGDSTAPCDSFGNGAAMRVSSVAYVARSHEELMLHAARSADATHNVEHAIHGARAMALAVYLARQRIRRKELGPRLARATGYDLDRSLDDVRGSSREFSSLCAETVPLAIRAFLEAEDFEHSLRLAISVGGDSDTIASMTGAIAGAYWGVPEYLREWAMAKLSAEQRDIVTRFEAKYGK